MFVLFVTTMHVPNALRGSDRFGWIVALRDLSFGGGAMCLAGASWRVPQGRRLESAFHAGPPDRRVGAGGVRRPSRHVPGQRAGRATEEDDAAMDSAAGRCGDT
jgi:hypothetical protein